MSRALAKLCRWRPTTAAGVMFTTGEVAYGLFYETKQRRFVLRSATMKTPKEPGDWRQLSMWLFDEGENTMQDAESIANDFLELVQGSKRRELVQTAKKRRKKDEENKRGSAVLSQPLGAGVPGAARRNERGTHRVRSGAHGTVCC